MADRLAPELARLVGEATLVLGPLGIGDHVDHLIVREALEQVADRKRFLYWEDWPYLDRAPDSRGAPDWAVSLDAELRETRVAMCGAYESQLGFQFGGRLRMEERLAAIEEERFIAPTAPALPKAR